MEYVEYLLPLKQVHVYGYYDEKYVWPCNESVKFKLNSMKSIHVFVGLHQFIQIHLKYTCVML